MFYAHSTSVRDRSNWQRLADHLTVVGERAAANGEKFGLAATARLSGFAHDLGKYSLAFQARLDGATGRVDHATAGAREIMRAASGSAASRVLSELSAYAVAGHHAGLADRHGGAASLQHRLTHAEIPELDPVWRGEIVLASPGAFVPGAHPDGRPGFQYAFLGRMIFSALVDADRRDTEDHGVKTGQEPAKSRDWPVLAEHVDAMIERLDTYVAGLGSPDSDPGLKVIRHRVLAAAKARADGERGLYTLTVPTGGGKTLSVMRFALGHAARHRSSPERQHGIERIVVAIPFTSVIDQAAKILRSILGHEAVLEHHSAIEAASAREEQDIRERGEDREQKLQLAMEDWAAPIVVTTNVQLFESLFSHRPSRCRKLHNLANSIIVLDEAQTIPLRLLRPCLAALDELVRNYGCTIVLCTATQPAVARPQFKGGLDLGPDREIAPDPAGLHQAMRRATIEIASEKMSDSDLVTALDGVDQGFAIVNSRRHALALFRAAQREKLAGLVHLTTRQYAAHRRAIVEDIKRALDPRAPRPCRLVATSLIEAGIDLDFVAGWRAMAGLESLVQSAGRVNREGRRPREASVLTVFEPADAANRPPADVADLIADFRRMAANHEDLAHPDAIARYYAEVYWRRGADLDVLEVEEDGRRTRRRVLDCFSIDRTGTNFAYRTVGENFHMVEDRMVPVIVATEAKAQAALERLNRPNVSAGSVARDLQTFLVQVPERYRRRLIARGDVQYRRPDLFGDQFAVLETAKLYDDYVGLLWEEDAELGSEDTVI